MLLELAIGDAYGAGFEYADFRHVKKHNDLSGYVKHPRHDLKPGRYTDDTQMTIALAEVIVEGSPWTPGVIAQKFVDVFKRDPRKGYAGGFYKFLKQVKDGDDFIQRIRPKSDKSGAAMRASPVGWFSTIEEVIERSEVQARVTHDTPDGINAAIAAALMVHYFLYDLGPKRDLGSFLRGHVQGEWDRPWKGQVGSRGWMSVRAAITAVQRSDGMSQLLKGCVSFTGDVDTVATIALASGSHSKEIEQDLPPRLSARLEHRRFGRDYLIALDKKLRAVGLAMKRQRSRQFP